MMTRRARRLRPPQRAGDRHRVRATRRRCWRGSPAASPRSSGFARWCKAAERRWLALGIRNISAVVADGTLGWKRQAPFDRILVTAAGAEPPGKLIAQLTDTGILVAPIGAQAETQRLTLFQRIGQNVDTRDLAAVRFLPAIAGVAQNL